MEKNERFAKCSMEVYICSPRANIIFDQMNGEFLEFEEDKEFDLNKKDFYKGFKVYKTKIQEIKNPKVNEELPKDNPFIPNLQWKVFVKDTDISKEFVQSLKSLFRYRNKKKLVLLAEVKNFENLKEFLNNYSTKNIYQNDFPIIFLSEKIGKTYLNSIMRDILLQLLLGQNALALPDDEIKPEVIKVYLEENKIQMNYDIISYLRITNDNKFDSNELYISLLRFYSYWNQLGDSFSFPYSKKRMEAAPIVTNKDEEEKDSEKKSNQIDSECGSSITLLNGVALYEYIKDITKRNYSLNFLICGKAGAGKSTFINKFLGENRAKTGIGDSITDQIKKYSHKNYPICIFDTPGFETGATNNEADNYAKIKEEIKKLYKGLDESKKQIHGVFFCINQGTNRTLFKEDEVLLKELSSSYENLPVYFIITKCKIEENKGKIEFDSDALNNVKITKENIEEMNKNSKLKLQVDNVFPIDSFSLLGYEQLFKKIYDDKKSVLNNVGNTTYLDPSKNLLYQKEFVKNITSSKDIKIFCATKVCEIIQSTISNYLLHSIMTNLLLGDNEFSLLVNVQGIKEELSHMICGIACAYGEDKQLISDVHKQFINPCAVEFVEKFHPLITKSTKAIQAFDLIDTYFSKDTKNLGFDLPSIARKKITTRNVPDVYQFYFFGVYALIRYTNDLDKIGTEKIWTEIGRNIIAGVKGLEKIYKSFILDMDKLKEEFMKKKTSNQEGGENEENDAPTPLGNK